MKLRLLQQLVGVTFPNPVAAQHGLKVPLDKKTVLVMQKPAKGLPARGNHVCKDVRGP